MSLFKYIERIKTIHHLIEKESTGSSIEFAKNVGISRSLLMEHIKEMRETFHAPIEFCRIRQSFYYKESFLLNIEITSGMSKLKGGQNSFRVFLKSPEVLDSESLNLHLWTIGC
ncbi:MAG: hypothetical protein IM631_21415 [Cytophagales bacterium]|nr:hypothetical protein [Cytophagales bacterium]MCA6373926.1 hypothetical protein [Cytophagales bacterium]MCA6377857.1 hypothetical protein [Cytophagales bacterium]MCA6385896.1 hypothetical protein [Cytophagales bacterium]